MSGMDGRQRSGKWISGRTSGKAWPLAREIDTCLSELGVAGSAILTAQ